MFSFCDYCLVADFEYVVRRERMAGIYRLSAYFLAVLTTEIPVIIIQAIVVVVVPYWTTNMPADARIFFLVFSTVLIFSFACQVCEFIVVNGQNRTSAFHKVV